MVTWYRLENLTTKSSFYSKAVLKIVNGFETFIEHLHGNEAVYVDFHGNSRYHNYASQNDQINHVLQASFGAISN